MMRSRLMDEFTIPDSFERGGQTRWYVRERTMQVDTIRFYKHTHVRPDKFAVASPALPYKFYRYVWEKVLDLGGFGTVGSDRWYEAVDLICDDPEKCEMAWMMFTLEGENDQFKRQQANKKKSPAKRRQPNRAKKV